MCVKLFWVLFGSFERVLKIFHKCEFLLSFLCLIKTLSRTSVQWGAEPEGKNVVCVLYQNFVEDGVT